MSSLIRISFTDPAFANRPRSAYINCDDIIEIADHYDKDGRLLSSNSKLTLSNGKTYIVVESVSGLTARIEQECPTPTNIAGPQGETGPTGATGATGPTGPTGPQGEPGTSITSFPLNGTATTASETPATQFIGAIYLQAGTLSNTSTAYVLVEREMAGQTPDNNTAITGGITIESYDNPAIIATLYLSTNELINSGLSIEGPTTNFTGAGVVGSGGWYKVYAVAAGSKSSPGNVTNGCTVTVYGLNLEYQ